MSNKKTNEKDNTKKNIKKKTKNSNQKEKELFTTYTIVTEKEFKKYQKFYLNKYKNNLIAKIILILLAVIALYLNYTKGNVDVVILIIIFIILYPIVLNLTLNHQIKKMYRSSRRINDLVENLFFYKDYFEKTSEHGTLHIPYDDIYCLCETKDNFYIFLSDHEAIIIIKANLNEEKKEEFKDFIIQKVNGKYKRFR